jgi:hypothetical protein
MSDSSDCRLQLRHFLKLCRTEIALKLFGTFHLDKEENKTAVGIGSFRLFTYAIFMTAGPSGRAV